MPENPEIIAALLRQRTPVSFRAGGVRPLPLKPTAVARLVANLVDNALAYGAPPVEITTADGIADYKEALKLLGE